MFDLLSSPSGYSCHLNGNRVVAQRREGEPQENEPEEKKSHREKALLLAGQVDFLTRRSNKQERLTGHHHTASVQRRNPPFPPFCILPEQRVKQKRRRSNPAVECHPIEGAFYPVERYRERNTERERQPRTKAGVCSPCCKAAIPKQQPCGF